MSDGVKGKAGRAEIDQWPRCVDDGDDNAVSNLGRVAGDGLMRAGEAENAVRAADAVRGSGRYFCRAPAVMNAELESRGAVVCLCR